MSIKGVALSLWVRRSHTEWQVFLPRSRLTAEPPLPCATLTFHRGASKSSLCLLRCDSPVSGAACCCSGNSGWLLGIQSAVRWKEVSTSCTGPLMLLMKSGAVSSVQLLWKGSGSTSHSARGAESCCQYILFLLSSGTFILFLFFIKWIMLFKPLIFGLLMHEMLYLCSISTSCIYSMSYNFMILIEFLFFSVKPFISFLWSINMLMLKFWLNGLLLPNHWLTCISF